MVCMSYCWLSTVSMMCLLSSHRLRRVRLWFRLGMIQGEGADLECWLLLHGHSRLQTPLSCTRCANWSDSLLHTNKHLNNVSSCPKASDQNPSIQTPCSSTTR